MRLCEERQQWEDRMDQWSESKKRKVIDHWLESSGRSLWGGGGVDRNLDQRPGKVLESWRLRRQSSWSG